MAESEAAGGVGWGEEVGSVPGVSLVMHTGITLTVRTTGKFD